MTPTTTQRTLSLVAALANCLTAGAISTFPLWSPPLSRNLHLTSSQLNILASSAILGQYVTAASAGSVADSYGPGVVSIGGGACFGVGFGLLGLIARLGAEMDRQGKEINKLIWTLACVTYFLAGCGVAGSYFSAMIASTKSAPARHAGLAIGIPCAVFGLSPLFLSLLASFFTTSYAPNPSLPQYIEIELDPGRWLLFLAALLAAVNGIGGLFLKELPWKEEGESGGLAKVDADVGCDTIDGERFASDEHDRVEPTERSALLPSRQPHSTLGRRTSHGSDHHHHHHSHHHHHHHPHQTLRQFVSNPTFWLFGSLIFLTTGPAEMYMASLGQILESLLAISTRTTKIPSSAAHALQSRRDHIAVLSIANTVSRLVIGGVSDYLSSPPSSSPPSNSEEGESIVSRGGKRISRLVFLFGACFALAVAYGWGGIGLSSETGLWIVTIVNGLSYGTIFTLCPAIVRKVYPVENFGRNWGLLTWFSALGAMLFTPLFGLLRDLATPSLPTLSSLSTTLSTTMITRTPICTSPDCYRPIFLVSATSVGLSCGVVVLMWRKWKNIV